MNLFQFLEQTSALLEGATFVEGKILEPDLAILREIVWRMGEAKLISHSVTPRKLPAASSVGMRRPDLVGDEFLLPDCRTVIEDPCSLSFVFEDEPRKSGIAAPRGVVIFSDMSPAAARHYTNVRDHSHFLRADLELGPEPVHCFFGLVQNFADIGVERPPYGEALPICEVVLSSEAIHDVAVYFPESLAGVVVFDGSPRYVAPRIVESCSEWTVNGFISNVATVYCLLAYERELSESKGDREQV